MVKRTRAVLALARITEIFALPFTMLAAVWLKLCRTLGLQHLPLTKRVLLSIGVLPVRNHYYEPLIDASQLRYDLSVDRKLPAIDLNVSEQLEFLGRFHYQNELAEMPLRKTERLEYYYHNGSFASGDAEFLYSVVRLIKPKRILEIGCGFSTLMMQQAIKRNTEENNAYACEHVCVEPYEQPWLDTLEIKLLRRRVEDCDSELFLSLGASDILFIDSSHIIRPQGDVLFEYLEMLPLLKPGVFVHIHDIFTPRDYLGEWVIDEIRLWNEQYLLEAFLSFNSQFRVIGALNFLKRHHAESISKKFPILAEEIAYREPGSFWMIRQ